MSAVSELATNPVTYVAATVFLHTLTTLLNRPNKGAQDAYKRRLNGIESTLGEGHIILREVAKTVSAIALAQMRSDETEEMVKRELEKLSGLLRDLSDLHKDSGSKFSTVKVLDKQDEIIRMINDIKLTLAGG